MINKAMFRQVQAFKRQGYSKGAIGRALELDPRTVAKYFAMEEEDFRAYRQEHLFRDKAFDRFRREILEVYEANDVRGLQARIWTVLAAVLLMVVYSIPHSVLGSELDYSKLTPPAKTDVLK